MSKIAITGAAGRMGRTLIEIIQQTPGAELTGAVERPGISIIGADAGEVAGVGALGVKIVDNLESPMRQRLISKFAQQPTRRW